VAEMLGNSDIHRLGNNPVSFREIYDYLFNFGDIS